MQELQLRRGRRLHRRKYVSKGQNYIWHIDGHYKLKPFGFSVYGWIDWFSRNLILLKVEFAYKNTDVTARYLDAISDLGGVARIKADDGTEHRLIEPIHIYLFHQWRRDWKCFQHYHFTSHPENRDILVHIIMG